MTSRGLTPILIRTLVVFVVALVAQVIFGWSWIGLLALALIAAAALVQLGGVLWLRRRESEQL